MIFMGYNRYSFAKKISKLKEKTPNILRQFIGQGIRLVPSGFMMLIDHSKITWVMDFLIKCQNFQIF